MERTSWAAIVLALGILGFGCGKEEPAAPETPAEQPQATEAVTPAAPAPDLPETASNEQTASESAASPETQGEDAKVLNAVGSALFRAAVGGSGEPAGQGAPPYQPQ
jgi:hypothetical protein